MTTRGVLAAVVTMKQRGDLALKALRSLRPYVDVLCLYCNGYDTTPEWLREPGASAGLVDQIHFDPANEAGDRGNLYWADKHRGLYLSCDDDLLYAEQYSTIMAHWVERWQGQALVTIHGMRFKPHTQYWRQTIYPPAPTVQVRRKSSGHSAVVKAKPVVHTGWDERLSWRKPQMAGAWIHQPGSGVLAWDASKLKVEWPTEKNNADLLLGIWAYQQRIPVFCAPHGGWEVADILSDDAWSIWDSDKKDDFRRRNKLIQACDWITTHKVLNSGELHP